MKTPRKPIPNLNSDQRLACACALRNRVCELFKLRRCYRNHREGLAPLKASIAALRVIRLMTLHADL